MADGTVVARVLRPVPALVRMDTVTPEEIEFLWKPYLPRRKVVQIGGDPDAGKTYMVLAVLAALSRGAPLPGERSPREPLRSLYLTAEDGLADTIVRRLAIMEADRSMITCLAGRVVNGVVHEEPLLLSHPRDFDLLKAAVADVRPAVVVFDPIQGFLGGGVDIHRANQVRPILTRIQHLGEQGDFTTVFVGHLTKGGRDRSLYRLLGSIDFVAHARSVLLVARDPELGGGRRVVVHEKMNLAAKGPSLAFEIRPDGAFLWAGESKLTAEDLLRPTSGEDARQFETAKTFLTDLLTEGPVASESIFQDGQRIGVSRSTLFRAKSALGIQARKRGFSGPWEWVLPSRNGASP